MFSTRVDPADSRRGIASIKVYNSKIRFVEKNRDVEVVKVRSIHGICLHDYLRDFDPGNTVSVYAGFSEGLSPFGGRNLPDQCFLEQRAARSI